MKYNSEALDHTNPHDPVCIGCNKRAADMFEYQAQNYESEEEFNAASEEERKRKAVEFCRNEEGTYNHENGHFLCTPCYVEAEMPSSPRGWRAP